VVNLANDLLHAQTVTELRAKMMAMLREEKDPRALGEAAIFDTYKYTGGRAKGYETWLKAQDEQLVQSVAAKNSSSPPKAAKKARAVK